MVLEFATARNKNGNRLYLGVNTEDKTFSRERGAWYSRADVIQITKKERRAIIERAEAAGYTEIAYFNRRPEK